MRLGYIEQQQNHLDKAEKWFREVLTTSNSSKDVSVLRLLISTNPTRLN